jgi:DNA-binding MarR family transcriptional regulator
MKETSEIRLIRRNGRVFDPHEIRPGFQRPDQSGVVANSSCSVPTSRDRIAGFQPPGSAVLMTITPGFSARCALDFTTLKKRLETADGSLNLHLRRLEENGYITSHKAFVGLRPKTTYRMTPTGRKALTGYVKAMRELLEALEPTNS